MSLVAFAQDNPSLPKAFLHKYFLNSLPIYVFVLRIRLLYNYSDMKSNQ